MLKRKQRKNEILIKKVLLRGQKRANGFEAPEKICMMVFLSFVSVPKWGCYVSKRESDNKGKRVSKIARDNR